MRDYTLRDLDDVAEILADPAVFWWAKEPFTRERARSWLDEEMSLAARDGTGRRAIVLRSSGKVIGGAGLVWRDLETGREIELGYHLHHAYWGQGYATEAGAAWLEQARGLGPAAHRQPDLRRQPAFRGGRPAPGHEPRTRARLGRPAAPHVGAPSSAARSR